MGNALLLPLHLHHPLRRINIALWYTKCPSQVERIIKVPRRRPAATIRSWTRWNNRPVEPWTSPPIPLHSSWASIVRQSVSHTHSCRVPDVARRRLMINEVRQLMWQMWHVLRAFFVCVLIVVRPACCCCCFCCCCHVDPREISAKITILPNQLSSTLLCSARTAA